MRIALSAAPKRIEFLEVYCLTRKATFYQALQNCMPTVFMPLGEPILEHSSLSFFIIFVILSNFNLVDAH